MTNVIVESVIEQIVNAVADVVEKRLEAKGMASLTLSPETLQSSVLSLVETNTGVRDAIRDLIDDKVNDIDLDDLKQFSSLEERVTELENNDTAIDADDENFSDAVRSVIRNSI